MKFLRDLIPKNRNEWPRAILTTPLLLVYLGVVVPPVWAFHARESRDGWQLALLGLMVDGVAAIAYFGFA